VKLNQKRLARPSLGGMLATRQGSLTLALLCAACAAGILMFALGRYRTSLQATTKQATVLVATGEIQKGTSGDTIAAEKLYKSTPIVSTQLAVGAIGNASAIAGQTAVADILPGQQLTAADFAAATGVPGVLTPNQRAISVSIDEPHGDTDVVRAGDHVDIYTTFTVHDKPSMLLLAPNVLVLKPASATPAVIGGTPVTGGSLILAVNSRQVPQVAFASDNGKLFLSLRPTHAAPTPATPVTEQSLVAAITAAAQPATAQPATASSAAAGQPISKSPTTSGAHS
jgi:Flp pilus assembly protein CpaB